jgi:capsular exopolysaccharide synthesis family protein
MSRIHEALKKAEQERIGGVPSDPTALEGIPPVEPVVRPDLPAAAPNAELHRGETETSQASLTYEALLAGCARHPWKPDLRTMLFFNGRKQTEGMEEFRTLRSKLYQIREKQRLQTLLVTSTLPGEGKTFVAANLAQAIIRQHGRRVLLIDSDLRRPQLHLALGAPASPGLSDYLLGKAEVISILQHSPMENLFFIARGQEVSNPSELLAGGRLKQLLERLAPIFDWIILDSPAAIALSDASQLAQECDGVLLVVRATETPFDLAQKIRQEFADRFLVGVVLNQVEAREVYGYYYSYYAKNPNPKAAS